MASCQFEEKEYEIAAAAELGRSGQVFGAGQVVESILGYDATAAPARDARIWGILSVPRPPGVRLVPTHWQPGQAPAASFLPSTLVSLVIQYKRSDYLYGATARQWRLWNRPYFRFARTQRQHTILQRLERNLRDDAVVRYAAPAFWQRGELEAAQIAGVVLESSGFVPPSTIGSHTFWTYTQPGLIGRPNPRGRAGRVETITEVLSGFQEPPAPALLPDQARPHGLFEPDSELYVHLGRVAGAAVDRMPTLRSRIIRWMDALSQRDAEFELTPFEIQMLGSVAAIVTLTDTMSASWHLGTRPRPS